MPSPFKAIEAELDSLQAKAKAVFDTLDEKRKKVLNETLDGMGLITKAVSDGAEAVSSSLEQVSGRVTSAQQTATTAMSAIQEQMAGLSDNGATQLDDLLFRLKGFDNAWSGILKDAIEQMKEGILSGEDFIAKFGDFQITLGDKTLKIRELLEDMDLDHYQQQAQDFMAELQSKQLSLAELVAEFGELNNQYAKQMAEAIKLYQAGQLTLEELVREAERLKKVMGPGSKPGALADELLQGLQNGSLSGRP